MKRKKYKFTGKTRRGFGRILHQIRALVPLPGVEAGACGGWIEGERNLSHDGDCWVFGDASVCDNAQVLDNALIYDAARVYGNAKVYDGAWFVIMRWFQGTHGFSGTPEYLITRGLAGMRGRMAMRRYPASHSSATLHGSENHPISGFPRRLARKIHP